MAKKWKKMKISTKNEKNEVPWKKEKKKKMKKWKKMRSGQPEGWNILAVVFLYANLELLFRVRCMVSNGVIVIVLPITRILGARNKNCLAFDQDQ